MNLIEKIKADQVAARKARDTVTATLLTTLLGEANMVAKNAQREVPTDEEVQVVVKKFLKGNAETQAVINKSQPIAANLEKLGVAIAEQKILDGLLPKQMTKEEIEAAIEEAIEHGVELTMGALMGALKKQYAGLYDGKIASAVIKANLS